MALLRVLAFDPEGRTVAFDTWHDDLQLYLLSDLKDIVSLFDHVSGAAPAPPATADVSTCSQWLSRDATARLATRNHLPATECAHFGEHRTAQALYDAVVAHYSSPATAAIGRLLLPYLFPELSAFATVADLVTHLHTSDARYHATVPAEFLPTNQPPMFITLYFIVTRLPDSLRTGVTLSAAALHALTMPHLLSLVMTSSALTGRSCLGIAAAALGASTSSTPPGTAPAEALHTFTLDSGASRCFFRDSTTLTPLPVPVPVRLADPSGGLVVAISSTVLPCPAVPSGSLSGLHLPSFSTNLVSTAALQDAMVTTTTPGDQRVSICTCIWPGRHLATFTRRPGSNLYTLATEPPHVAASAQVSALGQVAASCSCRLLSHQTLLWHQHLGHPSLPRLRGMHSRLLVSGLPRSLPPLPSSPAPPCLPCVEGWQRAAPHSSSFPPTTASLQTLHMDVWGPARVSGQGHERYFLLVVDDYTRYTTVFLLHSKGEVLGVPSSTGLPPPFLCPPRDQSQPQLQPASPLPVPSPYTEQSGGLTERHELASRPVSPNRTARRAPRSRPPQFLGTHTMALRPSSVPLRVPLPAPPESSLPEVPDLESDRARAASPTVARLLATATTDPSFESAAASALVAELLHFAAACRLDYASPLVAKSVPASPPSVGGESALGTDVLEDKQEDFECLAAAVPRFASLLLAPEGDPDAPDIPTPRSYAEAITVPYTSQWQAAMDAEMASWKSIGTYVDDVPPPGANIVDGMWIFRGVDYFQTFSPTPKMTTLWVLLHVAAQRDYELHSLDFSTAFLQGSLHEEIWLRRPPGFTGLFPAGTQWSLRRLVYGLRQAPREWHDTLRTTLAALGFAPSTADSSLFLRTDTSLPPFYVLLYVDDLIFSTADTEALTLVKLELQKRHTCAYMGELRSYLGLQITLCQRRYVPLTWVNCAAILACSSSVLSSSCEAEIYAGAMAAQELRWLTYLLTDLGEQPRSPPVLYVDKKAMIALC
ncbi:unnamed protein product [Closterium sp. NIES-53]